MKARKRVVTSPGVRAPGSRRQPTVRRIKPAIVPAPRPGRPAAAAPGGSAARAASTPRVPDVATGGSVDPAVDLSVDLGRGLVLANPIVAASGAFGYGVEAADVVDVDRLGAICTRGTTLKPRSGNPPPRVAEVPAGLLNAVGLQNPGLEAVLERYAPTWAGWRTPVVVNLAADSVGEFAELARRLDEATGVAGIELNLSCPNAARGGTQFALDADAAGAVTAAVRRATDLPLLVKLSPNAGDVRAVARAVAGAGADAIAAINTVAGLVVEPSGGRPALGGGYGGLSGPAVKPIALRVVWEVAQVVDVPVVALGGVTELADVLDFLAAGATAVGVGTALFADPGLAVRLVDELEGACRQRGLPSIAALRGSALPPRVAPPSTRAVEYRP